MGKLGSELIHPLLRSLDGMPVHIRELGEMLRRHGNAHKRNTDEITDLDKLPDAWKGDTWTPKDVLRESRGGRPDPDAYLDADYIADHLDKFKDGASRIYTSGSLHQWGPGNGGTTFVFPTSELQDILDETGGDARQLALRLGLDEGSFLDRAGNPLEVELRHFSPDELTNLRLPSGNEGGANDYWLPGGYLPTGVPEAVIDVPETATGFGPMIDGVYHGDYNPGMWPGRGESLTLS